MYLLFFFLILIYDLNAQSCCNNRNICQANASCFCQGTIDTCIYQVTSDKIVFNLHNGTNMFNWVPFTNEYLSITINFCSVTNTLNQKYKAGFIVQHSNGTGYPSNTNITFSFSENCYQTLISDLKFCTAPSGGYCNLIMSLIPENFDFNKIQMQISFVLGLASYITYILVIIGVILFLVIIILAGCLLYRRVYRSSIQNNKNQPENTIQHFQKYLPKTTLLAMIQNLVLPQDKYSCSVCLNEIDLQQQIRKTSCCHIFHSVCLDLWCVKRLTCPMCRQALDKQSIIQKNIDQSLVPINIVNIVTTIPQQTQNNLVPNT